MAKAQSTGTVKRRRPALTPESNEQYMISLAMECAEKQLKDGTASSQVITHFLKLGCSKYEREIEKLEEENKLLRAKTNALESAERISELYENAIAVMKQYAGYGDIDEDDY